MCRWPWCTILQYRFTDGPFHSIAVGRNTSTCSFRHRMRAGLANLPGGDFSAYDNRDIAWTQTKGFIQPQVALHNPNVVACRPRWISARILLEQHISCCSFTTHRLQDRCPTFCIQPTTPVLRGVVESDAEASVRHCLSRADMGVVTLSQVMVHDRYLYDRERREWTIGKYLDDLKTRYGGELACHYARASHPRCLKGEPSPAQPTECNPT